MANYSKQNTPALYSHSKCFRISNINSNVNIGGGEKVAITDEVIVISQLSGAHARAAPKCTPMLRTYKVPQS